jgi:hypothetical protein
VWWWLPLAWVALGLVLSLQFWAWGQMEWRDALRIGLAEWGPWLVIGPAAVGLALKFPFTGRRWGVALLVHGVAALLAALVLDGVGGLLFEGGRPGFMRVRGGEMRISRDGGPMGEGRMRPPPGGMGEMGSAGREPGPGGPGGPGPGGPGGRERGRMAGPVPFWLMRLRFTLPLYALLVAVAHVIQYQHAGRERDRRAARVEAQLAEARLAALQLQLQPHFLFNCLNAISTLVHTQPDTAEEMICALAALLRAALDLRDRREVPLEDELALAGRYLAIQQIRFPANLEIQFQIEPDARGSAVPPLLLQPLLENAMVHGLGGRGGAIRIEAARVGDQLVLAVVDRPASPVPSAGHGSGAHVGLSNTRARLATLYGPAAGLELTRESEGCTARVQLPWRAA